MAYGTNNWDPLTTQTTGTGVAPPIDPTASGPYGPHGQSGDPDVVWDPDSRTYMNKDEFDRTHGNTGSDGNSPTAHGVARMQPYNAQDEANRFGAAASNPLYTSGPQIDQGQIGQSRGLSMGAIGLLGARASGAQTPADALAAQQTTGAVNSLYSGAASIKGGAGARAAAARGAVAQGAQVQALGNQDASALHARGMADASGQYFGATNAQRGQDLGLATTQAQLDAQQRAANEQRSENYEDLRFGAQKEATDTALGRSAEQQAATNAGRNQTLQDNEASTARQQTVIGTGASGIAGGASAYSASQQPAKSDNPWDPSNYSGSDPREKTAIRPVSDKEAARLNDTGTGILNGLRAGLSGGASVGAHEYDGKYLPSPFFAPPARSAAPAKPSLDEAMRASGSVEDPYDNPPTRLPNDSPFGAHIPKGYAAMRAGHEGAMFGGPAPVARDYGDRDRAMRNREVVLSDPRAKAAAWDEGRQAAIAQFRTASQMTPAELKQHAAGTPEVAAVKDVRAGSWDEGRRATKEGAAQEAREYMRDHGMQEAPAAGSPITPPAGMAPLPPAAPAPAPQAEPSFFGQIANRAKAALYTPSDPKTKTGVKDSPMADANRSMAPSVYEYKAEFTPPEQQPGEKNVGPMANKMEADPVARTAIVKDPNTGLLAIDKTKALKLVMGSLGDMQRQLDQMKGARR